VGINDGRADGEVSDVNVTASVLPTGASTSANQSAANASLSSIDTKLTDNATAGNQLTLNTRIGDLAETAPVSDTASSGLNGRLQRIAQRITSLISALSDRTAKFQITNGTNDAAVTNSAPAANDYALAVRPISLELPTFSISEFDIQVGNNKSMLAIQNTGSSIVRIREVWIINDRTTAVTGIAGEFQVRRIASFTGGTTVTPVSYDTDDSLPAGITAATNATVSGEGDILRRGRWSTDEWGPGTLDTEGLDHATQNTEPFWRQTPNGKGLTIRNGQGIHVKFATNSTAGFFTIRMIFTTE